MLNVNVNVNVLHDVGPTLAGVIGPALASLARDGALILSRLDELKSANADADAAIARIGEDTTHTASVVQDLRDQVAALSAAQATGGFTAEESAELAALRAKLQAIDPDPSFPAPTPPPAP